MDAVLSLIRVTGYRDYKVIVMLPMSTSPDDILFILLNTLKSCNRAVV